MLHTALHKLVYKSRLLQEASLQITVTTRSSA